MYVMNNFNISVRTVKTFSGYCVALFFYLACMQTCRFYFGCIEKRRSIHADNFFLNFVFALILSEQ